MLIILLIFLKTVSNYFESIDLMIKNIVHFDMHGGNIIINKETNSPMIIDFGLSFFVKKFKREELKNTFLLLTHMNGQYIHQKYII